MNKFLIKNLSKSFTKEENEKIIFNNLNLEISCDEITVILGKSGYGKTTLLRILSGLDEDYGGEVSYIKNGEKQEAKIGYVFQEPRLMPWLDIKKNIFIHEKEKINKKEVEKILKLVSLEKGVENLYPYELSGGMASRVSIGRALSYNPDVFLMDEPFAALDLVTRKNLQKEIINLYKKTSKGIIFVTHNLEEALILAKNIIVIHKNGYEFFDINKLYPRDIKDVELIDIKNRIKNLLNEGEENEE